jgi:hypothetical protein
VQAGWHRPDSAPATREEAPKLAVEPALDNRGQAALGDHGMAR